jgi:Na+-transporting NADH:ubiquinone oxidoreductase subunit F
MELFIYSIAVLCGLGGLMTVLLLIAERYLAHYGPCEVGVNEEEPFTLEGGRSVLDALYEREIYIPSACGGQGTCGYCKVTVLSGGGPVLPTELPYLTAAEIESGVRLACQVKIKQDLRLRIKEEFLHVRRFEAELVEARMLTHDTRELHLSLRESAEIDFRAGQYVQVFVPDQGETTFRAYSISSPPRQKDRIELVVRRIPGGVGSGYLHGVRPGETIRFTGPYGEFALREDPDVELVCVGGGCGLAPMKAILLDALTRWPQRSCRLFFGARTAADVFYYDFFREMSARHRNFEVHYALSEPDPHDVWEGETGFVHEVLDRHLPGTGPRQAFLCGPEPMILATREVLLSHGVSEDEIFYDEF